MLPQSLVDRRAPRGAVARLLGLVVAAAALSSAAGCDDPKVVCPPGYRVDGKYCYEIIDVGGEPDIAIEDDLFQGTDAAEPTDVAVGTDAVAQTDAAVGTDAFFPDLPKDTGSSGKSPVGAACQDEYDCLAGLTCHNWPKGYCSVINCKSPGNNCPGTAVCFGELAGKEICHADCLEDADCRTKDGYTCKRYTEAFGGIEARLCTPSGTTPAGLGCKLPSDCAGSATCLTDMAGGYCARIGCGPGDACEDGTACVLRNGKPVCMKTCTADVECQIATKEARTCVERTDLSKKTVKVCNDSKKSAPIGAECLADLDCDSKLCSIYAKGTCAVGGTPCLNDTQCGAAAPCNLSPDAEKGLCSQPCDATKKCPVNSVCVPAANSNVGTCSPVCKGPGDDVTCAIPGTECVYGLPLLPGGTPSYSAYGCSPLPAGSSGAFCYDSKDCQKGGICFENGQGTGGFCANPCGVDNYCPFGTTCGNVGIDVCLKLCSSDFDCPSAMVCKTSGQVNGKVCTQQ